MTQGRVLDIGCGPGYDTLEMKLAGADVLGIDTSNIALHTAKSAGGDGLQADELIYEGHDTTSEEIARLKAVGFEEVRLITETERGRPLLYARQR